MDMRRRGGKKIHEGTVGVTSRSVDLAPGGVAGARGAVRGAARGRRGAQPPDGGAAAATREAAAGAAAGGDADGAR